MFRRYSWFPLVVAVIAVPVAMFAVLLPGREHTALACTGGIAPLESLAQADVILIADAIEVGDAINRAPTPTVTPTASATASPHPSVTPSVTSVSPRPSLNPPGSFDFDLSGVGATFVVRRVIVGNPLETIEEWETRRSLEAEIRRRESVPWFELGNCRLGAFVVRYRQGQDYLLFYKSFEEGNAKWGSFPLDGDSVVLDDPLHNAANSGFLYMEPATRERYFPGALVVEPGSGVIDESRVPLNMMLRAIAGLRGDPSIAPPDAGNAGLKR